MRTEMLSVAGELVEMMKEPMENGMFYSLLSHLAPPDRALNLLRHTRNLAHRIEPTTTVCNIAQAVGSRVAPIIEAATGKIEVPSLTKTDVLFLRCGAIRVLGQLDDNRARQSLLDLMRDADETVRREAIIASGWIGDKTTANKLVELLGDTDVEVRTAAVWSLGRLREFSDFETLVPLLKDKQPVSSSAAESIGIIGNPKAAEPLLAALSETGRYGIQIPIAIALGRLKSSIAVPGLITLLSSDNPDAAGAAAWALGEIGDPRAIKSLTPLPGSISRDYRFDGPAIEALGKLKTKVKH